MNNINTNLAPRWDEMLQWMPKYSLVKLDLTHKIESGDFAEGKQLPTESALCEDYHCSRVTVRKALSELQADGYIYKVQGIGTFVKTSNPHKQNLKGITSCSSLISSQGMVPTRTVLREEMVPAEDDPAGALGIEKNTPVLLYERVYQGDDIPVIYSRSFFNTSVLPGIEKYDLRTHSIISILEKDYGIILKCTKRRIKAIFSDANSSRLLDIPEKYPLLEVSDLKVSDYNGKTIPIEYYTFLYVSDRIEYYPEQI